jgi:hypothetical protein
MEVVFTKSRPSLHALVTLLISRNHSTLIHSTYHPQETIQRSLPHRSNGKSQRLHTPILVHVSKKNTMSIISTYLDVLLGILQVFKEGIITPRNPTFLIGSTVRVSIGHTTLSTVEATKIRSLLVCPAGLDCMTLRALCLEDLGTLRFVTVLGHGCCLSLWVDDHALD